MRWMRTGSLPGHITGVLGVGDIGPECNLFGLHIARMVAVPKPATFMLLGIGAGALTCRKP